jgi:hypothetical protein
MIQKSLKVYPGSSRRFTITLKGDGGASLAGRFVDTDVPTAAVWAGEDQPPLMTPAVEWVDASVPSVSLIVSAADLAAAELTDDLYRLSVTVTTASDGEPHLGFDGLLQVMDAPGSGAALSSYATSADLASVSPEIAGMQSAQSDLAGFAAQRHEARTEFETRVLNRYRPQPGRSRRYLNAARTAAGPYLVFADSSDNSPPPTHAQLRTWLSTSRLLVTDEIRQANAYLAAALVYEDQITAGNQSTSNTYAALAKLYRANFDAKWAECTVEFDSTATVPAATPTHRIDRDVTYLT